MGKMRLQSTNTSQAARSDNAPLATLPARGGRVSFLLWFDTFLLVFFLLTMTPRLTGLAAHEILGVLFAAFLLVHLLSSWQWIKATTRKLITPGAWRVRINYSLNSALFAFASIAIVAGLIISQVVLPAFHIPSVNDRSWHFLHNRMASWVRIGVGLHIAMNWQWIVAAVRRETAIWRQRRARVKAEVRAKVSDFIEENQG
jgi:hypothetical protein